MGPVHQPLTLQSQPTTTISFLYAAFSNFMNREVNLMAQFSSMLKFVEDGCPKCPRGSLEEASRTFNLQESVE